MLIDLPFNITVELDYVILGVLFYCAGLVTVMGARKLRGIARCDYHADDTVVEAVVSEYTRRLRDYDRVIAEMKAKVDIVDARSQALVQPHVYVQPASQVQPHAQPVSEPVAVTQRAPVTPEPEGQNGTIDYILKLLNERPRTSREVQHAIGRTREHTARLMKKLHETGLVSRDVNAKPFRYNITDAGRTRLREKPAQAPEIRQAA
ncbi:MAG TPA: helix-turn-helix domain-containing protein [Nitrososphaera sp.]|jgi:hypothetical protein